MFAKFQDMEKAAVYLYEGLDRHPGDTWVEVVLYPDGTTSSRSMLVPIGNLVQTLQRFCRRFPEATAMLDAAAGMIEHGAIQCRCQSHVQEACPNRCQHHAQRPIVCAIVCAPNSRPSEEHKSAVVQKFHQMMHEYLGEKKRKKERLNLSL